MGARLSSNGNYNPALTKQPRNSIGIVKAELPNNFQQYPLNDTLSIPAPVRYSQLDNQASDTLLNEASHSESNQITTKQNTSPIDDNQLEQIQPSSNEKQLVLSTSIRSLQSKLLFSNHPIMHRDASIIYRSLIHFNHHRRINNNQFSFFGPQQLTIERNGKQFLIEFKERMERRHVQVFDETMGKMRLFEVVDFIPSRTVRSIETNPQFQASNHVPPSFSSTRPSILPAMINQRIEPAPPSNVVGLKTTDREFDIYHRGGHSHSPSAGHSSNHSYHSSIQSQIYNNSTTSSQEVPTQYIPSSYQPQPLSSGHHSPTATDYSASTSTNQTMTSGDESDSEAYDQTSSAYAKRTDNHPNVSYGTVGGHDSLASIDPFEKKINQRDPYYRKRQGIHNYAEPILKVRRFPSNNTSDYAPIPVAHKQTNSQRDSYGYYH